METQIEHTEKRKANQETIASRVERDEARQSDNLESLRQGASDIEARMREAAGMCGSSRARADAVDAQRQKSRSAGKSLSAKDLEEYQRL